MPKYFIFSGRKCMCLCIIYVSKSKSELFGFERGGRWRSRQMKTLVDTKTLWREVANGTLKGFRISLPLDQHRVVIFIN